MKIAVIYNRNSQNVINLFGNPNQEKYGLEAIKRIVNALKKGGHQVKAFEGDKELVDNLEHFMPRVLKGELPGLAFNLSYGIQGQARYTHVPGMLEMLGIPYVGSGPLAHSLALDKVVAKMIFKQNNLPTPAFAVLTSSDQTCPELSFPLIVKPRNEAVSMGLKIVKNAKELKDASKNILDNFGQSVLVEQYIDGREINIGILGNNPAEAFFPAELTFGEGGPQIYTIEDKKGQTNHRVSVHCPADLDETVGKQAQELALKAFAALGCYDCARIDMRLDKNNNIYILEINSLPSLGEHGSYVAAAEAMGMDFPALVNRLVNVASTRYFGTPSAPALSTRKRDHGEMIFKYLTERRDAIEKNIKTLVNLSSRTDDPVGKQLTAEELDHRFKELKLNRIDDFTDNHIVWTWGTQSTIENSTLLIAHLDVPVNPSLGAEHFRSDPEWLFGEGVGCSRAPLTMLEYALRSLKRIRKLQSQNIAVMLYADEGHNCKNSAPFIQRATALARQVLVLHAGNQNNRMITDRRGHRVYQLTLEGKPVKLGLSAQNSNIVAKSLDLMNQFSALSSRKERIGISPIDIKVDTFPRLLPHRITVIFQCSYPTISHAEQIEKTLQEIMEKVPYKWRLTETADRPPFKEQRSTMILFKKMKKVADDWSLPIDHESSVWPSPAGLVPTSTPVLCGCGPVAKELFTSREAVSRISLIQRTLLLAQFLLQQPESEK